MAITSEQIGLAAGLGAAMCWVLTSLWFAAAGRRIGPTAVNVIRLCLAVVLLGTVHAIMFEQLVPDVDREGWILLAVSGLIGLAIGDQLYFTALVDVGPRLASLLMTLAPPLVAVVSWPILDEPLGWIAIAGISITMGGIVWVVLERPEGLHHVHRGRHEEHRVRGIVFGASAGACQAFGLILSKIGMGHTRLPAAEHIHPWSATLVRMVFAASAMLIIIGVRRTMMARRADRPEQIDLDAGIDISPETEHLPREPSSARTEPVWRTALVFVMLGAIMGPVLGVWFSMESVDNIDAGIAATLMAMTPVFILPFAAIFEKERVTWRAILGAFIALLGVYLLSVRVGESADGTVAQGNPGMAIPGLACAEEPS